MNFLGTRRAWVIHGGGGVDEGRVRRRLLHEVADALTGIHGAVALIQELDGELGERSRVTAPAPCFLQRRLPLLRFEAMVLGL